MIYGAALQNARVNSRERQDKVLALRMFTFCLGRQDMPMQTVKYCKAMWEKEKNGSDNRNFMGLKQKKVGQPWR